MIVLLKSSDWVHFNTLLLRARGVLSDEQCGSPKDRLEDSQIRDGSVYHFYELPNHFAELLAITSPWGRGMWRK